MRFGSVCSGIEAASVAWEPLGWQAAWFSEIEPFPCRVLAHRFPDVPNLGDMTAIEARVLSGEVEAPDVLVGGTPCQAFSVAGLRGSLSDARGNLALVFVRLANAIDTVRAAAGKEPCFVLWENVPGVLSTRDNAFGAFLGGMVGAGSAVEPHRGRGWTDAGVVSGPRRTAAWRILDAQYFGVAQRRRRVFVLARGGARGWACADALLPLEPRGSGDSAPRREARKGAAGCAQAGAGVGSVARCITTGEGGRLDGESCTFVPEIAKALRAQAQDPHREDATTYIPELANTLKAEGFDASEDGTGRQPALAHEPFAFDEAQVTSPENRSHPESGKPCHSLARDSASRACVAFHLTQDQISDPEKTPALSAGNRKGCATIGVSVGWTVRRLMPVECERLQGFPDGHTAIDGAADGPRYRALGNSMAVPVMRWIGQRIQEVEGSR